MHLTKELFVIENEGGKKGEEFILYAPLKGAIAWANPGMIAMLKELKREGRSGLEEEFAPLRKVGIVTAGETPIEPYVPRQDFAPTSTTIMPGYDCPLRCTYCYASGGEGIGKVMDFKIARKAVDLIVRNASELGKKAGLEFHGGGEPLMGKHLGLVKEVTRYFKEQTKLRGLDSHSSCTSNGTFDSETLEWVVSNLDNIDISIDGPEDIQNAQRPMAGGLGSFSRVVDTIRALKSKGFEYHLRATVTKSSVSRMPEIVQFFNSISDENDFHLEPCFDCGRQNREGFGSPDPSDYLKNFIKAMKFAQSIGKKVHYSCSVVDNVYDFFCSAMMADTFYILPDGNVTSCLEVCRANDPRAGSFFIGRYDSEKGDFVFFKDKIMKLRSRNVNNIPGCTDCFAKYHCAGDCASKVCASSGDIFDTTKNSRCFINTGIMRQILINRLKGGEKYV